MLIKLFRKDKYEWFYSSFEQRSNYEMNEQIAYTEYGIEGISLRVKCFTCVEYKQSSELNFLREFPLHVCMCFLCCSEHYWLISKTKLLTSGFLKKTSSLVSYTIKSQIFFRFCNGEMLNVVGVCVCVCVCVCGGGGGGWAQMEKFESAVPYSSMVIR